MRAIRIYELDITYPAGADSDDGEWEEGGTRAFDGSPGEYWVPRWPQQRRFLSRTAAVNRAKGLAAMGCTVAVRQSEPIAWEADSAAHFSPQPSTPPAMECDPINQEGN
jgi:hypothetical protein